MSKVSNIFEEAALSEEEEEDNTLVDGDICNAVEFQQHFKINYKIASETALTLKRQYILSLCQDSCFTRIAAGISDGSVQIFDINAAAGGLSHASIAALPAPVAAAAATEPITICGVRFLDETPNQLLVGTSNGLVRLFDLRAAAKEQAVFQQKATWQTELAESNATVRQPQTITCFDSNANARILCTGTEQFQHNVFLVFYDVRERQQMGAYYESHQDDVTAVRFHAQNADLLCTGSTDGLINVFDIKASDEDEALQCTINTESSVHKLNWHKNVYEKDIVSCITHTNDFKAFECEESDLLAEFERAAVTKAMQRQNEANCNLIAAHNLQDDGILLLAGTNFNKGEILRSMRLQNKQLLPLADFKGNKQIVRESICDKKTNALVTAGESGIVTLWTPQSTADDTNTKSLKMKTKLKTHKKTPY